MTFPRLATVHRFGRCWSLTVFLAATGGCDQGSGGSEGGEPVGAGSSGSDGSSSGGESSPDGTEASDTETEKETGTGMGSDADCAEVSLQVADVFTGSCIEACHEPGGTYSTLELTPQAWESVLRNTSSVQSPLPLVTPGDLEQSYLWHKLVGSQQEDVAQGMGFTMPIGGTLAGDDMEVIESWILSCAA